MGLSVGRGSWNPSSVETEEFQCIPSGANHPCSENPCINERTGIRLFYLESTNKTQLVDDSTEGREV